MAVPNLINAAHVKEYESFVLHKAQRQKSHLRDAVRVRSGVKGATCDFNVLDYSEMVAGIRHGDTPIADDAHSVVTCTLLPYDKAFLVDKIDDIRTLIDQENEYTRNLLMAIGRRFDFSILKAMQDSTPTNSVSGTAGSGVTTAIMGDVLEAAIEYDWEDEERYMGYTGPALNTLLNDGKLSNADYNVGMALREGKLGPDEMWLGFKWRKLPNPRGTDTGGSGVVARTFDTTLDTEILYAWAKSGVGLGIGLEGSVSIDKRPDKRNAMQVYSTVDIGAVVVDADRIIKLTADYKA